MWEVMTDFDGTIVKDDLPDLILEKFGRPGWKRFDDLLANGKISVDECVSRQFAMIAAPNRGELIGCIRDSCRFRSGFDVLLRACRLRNIDLTVVSAGLDFTIRYAFRLARVTLPPMVCPKSSFMPHEGISLIFPKYRSSESRDFKEDYVVYKRKLGHNVIFVGDGAGDFNAAAMADEVFAVKHSTLDKMCSARNIPHHPIGTFVPMISFLASLPNWKTPTAVAL